MEQLAKAAQFPELAEVANDKLKALGLLKPLNTWLTPANEFVFLMGFCFSLQPGHPVAVCQQSAEANECLSGGEALQLLSFTKTGIFF